MKTLIGTIVRSSDHTFNILYVMAMLVFVCASFAYVYWHGSLSYRCMNIEVKCERNTDPPPFPKCHIPHHSAQLYVSSPLHPPVRSSRAFIRRASFTNRR